MTRPAGKSRWAAKAHAPERPATTFDCPARRSLTGERGLGGDWLEFHPRNA